jgi:hypothetical protein
MCTLPVAAGDYRIAEAPIAKTHPQQQWLLLNFNPLTPERKIMLALLEVLLNRRTRKFAASPDELKPSGRWVVDLPAISNVRLGPFRTKQEALDYRREYIIRKLTETNTAVELPL